MIVKQTRHIFEVKDILGVRLSCNYRNAETEEPCDGEAIYPFGDRKGWTWRCPTCGEDWKTEFPSNMPVDMRIVSPQEAATLHLLDSLETLMGPGCAKATIRFEIDGKEEK